MNILLQCLVCNHQFKIDKTWAIKSLGCDKYSSRDDVLYRLSINKNKLKCSECLRKNVKVIAPTKGNTNAQKEGIAKRYIDSGLAGPSSNSGGAGWISGIK